MGTLSACFEQEMTCFLEEGDEIIRKRVENVNLTLSGLCLQPGKDLMNL